MKTVYQYINRLHMNLITKIIKPTTKFPNYFLQIKYIMYSIMNKIFF